MPGKKHSKKNTDSPEPKKDKNSDPKKYNYIYKELVEHEYDLTGMIAYSLYKSEKIKYIKKIKEQRGEVTDKEVENYHISSKIRIEDYKERATNLFAAFCDDLIDDKVRMSEDIIEKIIVKTASPKGWENWLRSISQSFLGALIYTIIVSSILLGVWFYNSGNADSTKEFLKDSGKQILNLPQDTIIVE